jgi:hypothetical protein
MKVLKKPTATQKEIHATTSVTKTIMSQGEKKVVKDESTNDSLGIVHGDDALGLVSITMGVTRNLGNFESVKLGVSLSYPSTVENFDETFEAGRLWVDEKLNILNQAIDEELGG